MPIVGAVLCVVALLQIRRSGEKGAPLAIAGIALSIASLLVLAVGGAGAMFLLRSNVPPPVTDSAPMR
ncbi:MAG: DUF4190 domain-containing protein [Myxococcales bacterium]|nr:DUF4190 domain-containing protein [Myxococcales bacterium]